ncbi:MAG: hypothetical protein WD688_25795 [Candidatus Binatia bacterium]
MVINQIETLGKVVAAGLNGYAIGALGAEVDEFGGHHGDGRYLPADATGATESINSEGKVGGAGSRSAA